MYLRKLEITGMKLLRDFGLSFDQPDGAGHRPWTVLIGRNGTGKTAVLQAIALAAMGSRQVNSLADASTDHLQDRRPGAPELNIFASFSFSELAGRNGALPGLERPSKDLRLCSTVWQSQGSTLLAALSDYADSDENSKVPDPLDQARDQQRAHWFVAGYGPSRYLPDTAGAPNLKNPPLARLRPLFAPGSQAISTAFVDHFALEEASEKARTYVKLLSDALFIDPDVLPGIKRIEQAGRGGVKTSKSLQTGPRFEDIRGLKMPAAALGHGFQSTIAWIADLVGHVILEAQADIHPSDMRGLVLVDEIDLYLHPTWQVRFVSALKKTFPNLQFVVTTHSPLMLASLDPRTDQVVQLELDESSGSVKPTVINEDPRVMTASELLRTYFELESVHPGEVGKLLVDYRYLASNPYRTDQDDHTLEQWEKTLRAAGIDPHYSPVARREFKRAGT